MELAHQRPGARGSLALSDEQRRAVAVPRSGHLGLVRVFEGAADGEGCVCQEFHVPQSIRGLLGPAPPAGWGGVGDGLEWKSPTSMRT